MNKPIEVFDEMQVKALDDNLNFIGITKDKILKVKKLKNLIIDKNPSCNPEEEVKNLLLNGNLKELNLDEVNELEENQQESQELSKADIWHKDKLNNPTDRLNHLKVAQVINSLHKFYTKGSQKLEIYHYEDGKIKQGGSKVIASELQTLSEGKIKINDVNEVIGHIQRLTYSEGDFESPDLNLICVGNGIFNIQTYRISNHSPEYQFTQKIKWNYRPDAECPNIKKFLNEILSVEDVLVFQEFAGYCLFRQYRYKKALIFVGQKNTGKTTAINLLVNLIGTDNTSGVSLHRILYDKFAASRMKDRLLNFYDDLSFKDINDTGAFKIATGGGYISAEKKFGDSFEFMNYAKLLFATNKIAAVKDNDDLAYFDRWLILFFDNVSEKPDSNLLEKLTTKAEMEGFLVWALEGLKRLLSQDKFSYTPTAEENKISMERNSNSLSGFAADCLVNVQDVIITKEDLYKAYVEYCNNQKVAIITKDRFGKNLQGKARYILDSTANIEGKKERVWRNVAFANRSYTLLKTIFNKNISNNNTYFFIAYAIGKDVTAVTKTIQEVLNAQ